MSTRLLTTLLATFFLAAVMSPSYPTTWYVDQFGSSSADGTSPQHAFAKIADAVEAAGDGDTVILMPGSHYGASIHGKAITMRSVNPSDLPTVCGTIIAGRISVRDVQSGECTIAGLAIYTRGGDRTSGGVRFWDSAAVISDCLIYGNRPEKANDSGLGCVRSSVTITRCQISGHSAAYVTGAQRASVLLKDSEATISDCEIYQNITSGTAGIRCENSDVTITRCLIYENVSYGEEGSIVIDDSSSAVVTHSILHSNSGGPAISSSGSATIENCTLFGNEQGISGSKETRIANCILWNRGDELMGCFATCSCVYHGKSGKGNISVFPHFVNPGIGDFHLRSWSPCIDSGLPDSSYENEPSPNGGRINMGAYGNTLEAASASEDCDGHGLPDAWEMHWFGALGEVPGGDYDGDGRSNLEEYRSGGNPIGEAAMLYVDVSLGDDGLDGRSPVREEGATGPTATIRAAVGLACDGDRIEVAPGEYYERIDFLGKSLHLRAAEGPASTTIDAYFSGPAVTLTPWGKDLRGTLEGFRITNGRWERGGGIRCDSASLHVLACEIVCNYADADNGRRQATGGGIACADSDVVIRDCAIHDNVSQEIGGGIACTDSQVTISDCDIYNNMSEGDGAAVSCKDCSLNLVRCDIRENAFARHYDGGALYLENTTARVRQCRIHDNAPVNPYYQCITGGIYAVGSLVQVSQSLMARNSPGSGYGPGAIYCKGEGCLRVTNCTFYANPNGVIRVNDVITDITNSIFVGNGPSAITPTFSCTDWETEGGGNIEADPRFVDPEADDFRLLPESPCIDAGSLGAVLTPWLSVNGQEARLSWSPGQDLDGNPRISGAGVDMGAYEYQTTPANFVVEHSADLELWHEGGTTSGLEWVDDSITDFRQRFYRLSLPQ